MRNSIFIVWALLLLHSCVSTDEQLGVTKENSQLVKIVQKAKEYYSDFYGTDSRSVVPTIEIDKIYNYCNRNARSGNVDTLFYVVNFGDNEGFAILPANESCEPAIGVSDSGFYNPNEIHPNENFRYYMSMVISSLTSAPLPDFTTPTIPIQRRTLISYCPPIINVEWGQQFPYNTYCPNGYTGCCNTAVAMIMAHFGHPLEMAMTAGEWDVHIMQLDWDAIRLHMRYPDRCFEYDSAATHDMIAKLMRQIGSESISDYTSPDGTGTNIQNVVNYLSREGYDCTPLSGYSFVNYKSHLREGKPTLVIGSDLSIEDGGHCWILDGYKTYRFEPPLQLADFCHYNWGWDGDGNGYFQSGYFDVSNGYEYDNGDFNTALNFNFLVRGTTINYPSDN